jgi:hypothetical protein
MVAGMAKKYSPRFFCFHRTTILFFLLLFLIATKSNAQTPPTADANTQWYSVYFPTLFATTDPENASKAAAFLEANPSLKNFNNFNYLGYAYERNSDFKKARENYVAAQSYVADEKNMFHSYSYYTNFLSRSGEYLKAEEYIRKMVKLAAEASDLYKTSYKSEALTSQMIYYQSIGDYHNYVEAATEQYDYLATLPNSNASGCDLYSNTRYTIIAYAKETLKDYDAAELFWNKRDSASYVWGNCINKKFPQQTQYPLSMYPVYLLKRGKKNMLKKPISFYIEETEAHYNNFKQYADLSINFMHAEHLGFLGPIPCCLQGGNRSNCAQQRFSFFYLTLCFLCLLQHARPPL